MKNGTVLVIVKAALLPCIHQQAGPERRFGE